MAELELSGLRRIFSRARTGADLQCFAGDRTSRVSGFFQVFSGLSVRVRSGVFDSVRGAPADAERILAGSGWMRPEREWTARAPAMSDFRPIARSDCSALFGPVGKRTVRCGQDPTGFVGFGDAGAGRLAGDEAWVCPLTLSDAAPGASSDSGDSHCSRGSILCAQPFVWG